ncbi:M48 family metalloprotease [Sphingomonas sp.]|uniref:M48 family metalloprotease n=1 Tax=Sphingomonas sp. TaxID=28214 RepID=UPI001D248D42|nr:M48 family metalloprotease [Sphingomonas sp.]MBX9796616.1 M48 family metalloprotease [Sphingomonas sp.]
MRKFVAGLMLALAALAQPVQAQSILRDAETEAWLADLSRPIVIAAGLRPQDVQVVMINDPSLNAFVAGGQTVFIHSGTIQGADNANEVQGVIAHEIGHIVGGHVPLGDRGFRPALGISILSMVLGVAAALAGAGEAAAAVFGAGQQAAQLNYLSFSRDQEASADAAGARFLNDAGITGKGYLSFFGKLTQLEYRYGISRKDSFMLSHPVSSERIANLTDSLKGAPAWNKPSDPRIEESFRRIRAKLAGYVNEMNRTLQEFPPENQSIYAHYARAYAYHKGGFPEKANAEADALVARSPHDPYFLEVKGQILLESGKPREALIPLREATERTSYSPLIATTFGHALIASEDTANYAEAERVLRIAVGRDNENPFAWYQLGVIYERKGDTARAMLATAERASLMGDLRTAAYSARGALAGLPPNTPDWIRAQDIAITAANQMQDAGKKKR